jgi:VWFA-related protein
VKSTVIAAALVAGAIAAPPQRAEQVFRSGVQTVFVDVSVLHGHTPVTDLDASRLTLTDNGALQHVEAVAREAIPLDVSLVIDASIATVYYGGTTKSVIYSDEVQRNVRQMATTLRPEDRLGVMSFGADVVQTRPMSTVGAYPGEISLAYPAMDTMTDRYRITEALLTALTAPVAPDRRHLVVVFALNTGNAAIPMAEHLVPVARRADARLYGVLAPTHHEERTNLPFAFYPAEVIIRDAVTRATEATGGTAYLAGDIVGAFRDILKDFRSSYVLRYTLEGVPRAGWHDILVKVPSCPPCTIRARRGYMGTS